MATTIRILFVDDSGDDVFLAEDGLRRAGFSVASLKVQDEGALREAIEDFQPDIIVSDFAMPSLDGPRAFAIAKRLAPDTPFLFLSGGVRGRLASDVISRGALGYVEKGDTVTFSKLISLALHLNDTPGVRRNR